MRGLLRANEREAEGHRETDRQTDGWRESGTERLTDGQRELGTVSERVGNTDRQTDGQRELGTKTGR